MIKYQDQDTVVNCFFFPFSCSGARKLHLDRAVIRRENMIRNRSTGIGTCGNVAILHFHGRDETPRMRLSVRIAAVIMRWT